MGKKQISGGKDRKKGKNGRALPPRSTLVCAALNAREFRGDMLKSACREYDIDLHLRPVKKPHYGAHIERLMGTVTQGLKRVQGSTFSGPDEKGEYDAEGNAMLTFSEIEQWLILFFARYHIQRHNGIDMPPLRKWREGLLGTKKKPGRGLPPRRTDEETIRINFPPYIERTIQDYGVVIDDVHYYHDVLRPWVPTTPSIPILRCPVSIESRPLKERHFIIQLGAWLMLDLEAHLRQAWRNKAVRYNQLLKRKRT